MKGVILAGGLGTRLRPLTYVTNKHLLPVYDKPMIYYPIDTLKQMGVTEILIVSGGDHIGDFVELLGDGTNLGVHLSYRVQPQAGGIAEALLQAEGFVDGLFVTVLGDNYFSEPIPAPTHPTIYLKEVENPQRFGVFAHSRIIEKPEKPASNHAVVGLYAYDPTVFAFIRTLKPSARGELEITDVNNWCLEHGAEAVEVPGEWSDMGTFDSLLQVANAVSK